jgi:surface antigen
MSNLYCNKEAVIKDLKYLTTANLQLSNLSTKILNIKAKLDSRILQSESVNNNFENLTQSFKSITDSVNKIKKVTMQNVNDFVATDKKTEKTITNALSSISALSVAKTVSSVNKRTNYLKSSAYKTSSRINTVAKSASVKISSSKNGSFKVKNKKIPRSLSAVSNSAKNYVASVYGTNKGNLSQCTYYVTARRFDLGLKTFIRSARDAWGYGNYSGLSINNTAKIGDVVCFKPGSTGVNEYWGHVAIVEAINKDGSILISESNYDGKGSYRNRIVKVDSSFMRFLR